MVLSGRVYDSTKQASIAGAAVSVLDKDGNPLGLFTTTNDVGYFYISSPLVKLDSILLIEHPMYFTKELATSGATSYGLIGLSIKPVVAPVIPDIPQAPQVATGEKPISSYWWILVLLGFALWPGKKKR